ncbi:hypothetical protein [Neolewinella antarctica]|uniref:Uncharacterized protein n=1 Tax=Neolewinella antarctica TaxID=442734 RepID=A0ABX0X7V7_9BACT|nr:hypothetical protein [Neolewinella antarctica]NJC25320.1 hypothetical protein [Neolewinella antarctica]
MRYFTLLLFILLLSPLSAQVGINTDTPTQALHVAGKLRVADDNTAPDRGTIRFNDATSDFEGYDGTDWKVLSLEKSGAAPSKPVAYGGVTDVVISGAFFGEECEFFRVSAANSTDTTSFRRVPSGHYFLVTHIAVWDSDPDAANDERMAVTVRAGNSFLPSRRSAIATYTGSSYSFPPITGDSSNPLLIAREGESIIISSSLDGSETSLQVAFRGFLVEELDF